MGGGEGETQIEKIIDIHHTCKYINYAEQPKLSGGREEEMGEEESRSG